jgi:SAM-dependent methyltransferase
MLAVDKDLRQATLEVDDRHWWYRGRRAVIRAELDALVLGADSQVLDAGCGSGRTMQELEEYGTVRGIELDEDAAELARSRGHGEVTIGRLEQLPWPDGTFDLITSLDVIEHTADDRAALAELLRVCRPGGWLLVTVPAYQALWSEHDEANHHYRRYSRSMLRNAAAGAGWTITRMTSFNGVLLAPAAVVRLARRRFPAHNGAADDLTIPPAWLNDLLERPLRLEAGWLGHGHGLGLGLSLLAVMRRPSSS